MTQASVASLEGQFWSLTDLAIRILFPFIFLQKVLLLNLVTYSFCRTLVRNRTAGTWHQFLTYSSNAYRNSFDGPVQPCFPWCLLPHTLGSIVQLPLKWADRCLWILEGARKKAFGCTDAFFPPHFHSEQISLHLQWYLRVRLLKPRGKLENNNYLQGILMLYLKFL